MTELPVLGGSSAAHSFAYWGERQEWLIALTVHRDSDALERSNWDVITDDLLANFPTDHTAIETFSNWAVGWNMVLLVRPGTAAVARAQEWAEKLDNYPVADENHFSELEFGEEWCVRCDRGTREQHFDERLCNRFRDAEEADEIAYRWRTRRNYR